MNGISALINSPIHVNGELQGVLCIERVGPHSAWTSVQRLFAHAVANLVSLALLQHQLLQIKEELRDANSLRRAVAGARDAILISDATPGIFSTPTRRPRNCSDDLAAAARRLQSDAHASGDGLDSHCSRRPAPGASRCAARWSPRRQDHPGRDHRPGGTARKRPQDRAGRFPSPAVLEDPARADQRVTKVGL
jgi:hypothetical protein